MEILFSSEYFYLHIAYVTGIALVIILLVPYRWISARKFPPGPPGLPVIGNTVFVSNYRWREFSTLHKKYGPLLGLRFMGRNAVILGDLNTARQLLDGRSKKYSSRPPFIQINENLSGGLRMSFMPYGERWRSHRKFHARLLSFAQVAKYLPVQDMESKQVLFDLLNGPINSTQTYDIFYRFSCSVTFSLIYGRRLTYDPDNELAEMKKLTQRLKNLTAQGGAIVELFPILNRLPLFMAPWKRTAYSLRDDETAFMVRKFREAIALPFKTFCDEIHELTKKDGMPEVEQAFVASGFLPGNETTVVAIQSFVLAGVLHPEFVAKAQEEIDRVVGPNRLPTFDDIPKLAYVSAFMKESMRWRMVSPLGAPRITDEDDVYNGYLIPRGTLVMANQWAMGHDQNTFENAHIFNPERWMTTTMTEREMISATQFPFGFGRRICPGQHLANNTVNIVATRILWGFNLGHAVDGSMKEIPIDPLAYTQRGLTSQPQNFALSIKPRSQAYADLIKNEWLSTDTTLENLMTF